MLAVQYIRNSCCVFLSWIRLNSLTKVSHFPIVGLSNWNKVCDSCMKEMRIIQYCVEQSLLGSVFVSVGITCRLQIGFVIDGNKEKINLDKLIKKGCSFFLLSPS